MDSSKIQLRWDKHGAFKCAWERLPGYEWAQDIEPLEVYERGVLLHEKTYNVVRGDFEIQPCRAFDAGRSRAPFITEPIASMDGSVQGELYNPLDLSLHRSFAQLKSADECLAFARRFGLLGVGILGLDPNGAKTFYEPHNLWLSEASTFKFLLELSYLEFEQDHFDYVQKLRRLCEEEYRAQASFGYPTKSSLTLALAIVMKTGGTRQYSRVEAVDLRERATKAIQRQVNELLRNRVDVQVWGDDLRYVIVVRNLLSAMTLSLVQQLNQQSQSRSMCLRCDKPFQASRSDAKFCSARCRTAWSREKARDRAGKSREEQQA